MNKAKKLGKILIIDLYADDPNADAELETGILDCAEVEVLPAGADPEAALASADVVLFKAFRFDRKRLETCRHLKGLVRYGIGLDKVDLEAARDLGITVCNVPDGSTGEVADHTMALVLACLRRLPLMQQQAKTGHWHLPENMQIPSPRESIFGSLGFGRIARETISRAKSFGFRCAVYDPFVDPAAIQNEHVQPCTLEELLAISDVLTVQCPLNEQTKGVIGREALARMKASAILINTARGGLIDTEALLEALQSGHLAAVGLDVADPEPLPSGHPLYSYERAIVTPHVAWYSEAARGNIKKLVAEEARRLVKGELPRNRVV